MLAEPSRQAIGKPATTKLASAISVVLTIAIFVQLDRRIPPSNSSVVATTAQTASGTIQGGGGSGSGLGTQEHPTRRESHRRRQPAVAVLVGAAADWMRSRQLSAAQSIECGDQPSNENRKHDRWPGDSGRDPDADKDARANDGSEPHHHGAEQAHVTAKCGWLWRAARLRINGHGDERKNRRRTVRAAVYRAERKPRTR